MLKHYLSVAIRNFRATPLAFAMNVLTLALGIACFVMAYAFVVFWDGAEKHFANADRIAVLTQSFKLKDDSFSLDGETSTPKMAAEYLKADFPAIEQVARASAIGDKTMVSTGARALRSPAAAADAEFLELFDLPFVAGDARTALRTPKSVVLKKSYATQLFGHESPLGRHLLIGNLVDTTVTGVIDEIPEPSHLGRSQTAALNKFELLTSYDVLETINDSKRPRTAEPPNENWLAEDGITYMLLPADGSFTLSTLRAQLPEFTRRHVPPELGNFATLKHGVVRVRDLLGDAVNGGVFLSGVGMTVQHMLLTLGALVLGVACVNYANLATARAARRTREIGLRKALGAQRAHVALQSLVEAGVLTVIAVVAAFAIVQASMPLLKVLIGVDLAPTLYEGASFWLFLAAVIAAVTLAAGAYPALALANVRPVGALRASRAELGSKWLSTVLIGAQFAVASFLLIVVTITALQNAHLKRTGLASKSDPLVLIENTSSTTKVDSATLRAELARLPQVKGVTEIGAPPWVNLSATLLSATADENAPTKVVTTQAVGFDFFSAFDIGLVAGRVYSRDYDDEKRSEPPQEGAAAGSTPREPVPIVVDRGFVTEFGFASPEAAVGQIVYSPGNGAAAPLQIIGVVENHRFSFFGFVKATATSYGLATRLDYQVVRVSRDDVAGGLDGIDRTWRALAPNVAISRRFLDEYFNEVYTVYLRLGQVLTALALLAFAISLTGLFGMATLIAGRRRREVGVRKAHGASGARMVAMLLASFSRPVLVANVVAWPLGYIAARAYLDTFQAPIQLTPWPFALSLAITLAIAWLAVGSQTLRAARARPAEVLRYE
ncbi:MAG TPA: ABC transporter permease [Gammaproteobacteria bacterium]|nr:ABC transporter permease [Gammaproteobacteria bacterium]